MRVKWTEEAVNCFKRGCICNGCLLENLETKCRMKKTVIWLVKKAGKPKGVKEKTILKDE